MVESLGQASEIPGGTAPRVELALCSRFRCTKSRCTACATACPVPGRVRLGEQGPEITGACTGCGACSSACPTGALQPLQSDAQLGERISHRARRGAPFRIACPRGEGRFDLVLTCLARLTEALLLEALRGGAARVEVFDPGCSGCALEATAPRWTRTVGLAAEICAAAGLGSDRVFRVPVPSGHAEERGPEEVRRSRRALFRAVAAWTADRTLAGARTAGPHGDGSESFRDAVQKHRESPKRTHLLTVLHAIPGVRAQSSSVLAAEAPFAEIHVDRRCTACNVCERLCPTGALRSREQDGTYALEFEPALCTRCGVCEVACLRSAISMRDTVDLSALLERPRRTLVSSAVRTCALCRERFLEGSSELCPSCLVSGGRREMVARRFFSGGGQGAPR